MSEVLEHLGSELMKPFILISIDFDNTVAIDVLLFSSYRADIL